MRWCTPQEVPGGGSRGLLRLAQSSPCYRRLSMFLLDKIISLFAVSRCEEQSQKTRDSEDPKGNEANLGHKKNTYVDGVIHMFRATVGTGILALPVAFSQAGYAGGICAVVFVTYITYYCAEILAKCQRELSRRDKNTVPTYQGTVDAAFAQGPLKLRPLAPLVVNSTNVLILAGQIGSVCVYFIFIASNIKAATANYIDLDLRLWTVILAVPILAINLVVSLKRLAVVSSFGIGILLTSVGVVFYYVLREPISLEGRRAFGDFADLPQYFGTVFFASGCISLILPLQHEMAKPEQLEGNLGVLFMNALTTGSLYVVFGFLGYLKYGDMAQGTVTLNLPPGEVLSTGVQVLLALSVMTATALQNYISVSIIWDDYLEKHLTKHRLLAQYMLRVFVVLFILIISVSIPNLELVLSVTGVLGQCTLTGTFPCIVHILTYYKDCSRWDYVKKFWRDVVCILFSIFILITSISSIIFQLVNHEKVG